MRLLVFWFGSALVGYLVIVVPLLVIFDLHGAAAFLLGMAVGGLTPPLLLGCSKSVQRWVDR